MSGLLAGRLGLTEWAELEAHTAACEACDRALDLRYSDLFEERVERDRPVAWRAGRTAKRVGIGVAAVLVLGALGAYAYPRLPEISMSALRSLRPTALAGDLLESLTRSAPLVASGPTPAPARSAEDSQIAATSPVASAPARSAEDSRIASAPPVASAPAPAPARSAEDSPGASTPPLPSPPAAAHPAPSPPAPQAVPSSPAVTARPSVSPSAAAALPPRPATPRRPARVPEQKTTAPKVARERNVVQSPRAQDEQARASSPGPTADARTDVIAQLTVQDRQEARRDIGLLLARLGGSRMAEKDSQVWLVVPRSRYGEFTRGLAQIGSWQMEQGSGALPDPVAVTVILTR